MHFAVHNTKVLRMCLYRWFLWNWHLA